jgi:hypothetical protein
VSQRGACARCEHSALSHPIAGGCAVEGCACAGYLQPTPAPGPEPGEDRPRDRPQDRAMPPQPASGRRRLTGRRP